MHYSSGLHKMRIVSFSLSGPSPFCIQNYTLPQKQIRAQNIIIIYYVTNFPIKYSWNTVCNTNIRHVLKYCYDISLNNIYTKTSVSLKTVCSDAAYGRPAVYFYVTAFPIMSNWKIVCNTNIHHVLKYCYDILFNSIRV